MDNKTQHVPGNGEMISIPEVRFMFGDKKFRSLYGPANDKGERWIIAFIDEAFVVELGEILDKASGK